MAYLEDEERIRRLKAYIDSKGNKAQAARATGVNITTMRDFLQGITTVEMAQKMLDGLQGKVDSESVGLKSFPIPALLSWLRKGATIAEISDAIDFSERIVSQEIAKLSDQGVNVQNTGGLWKVDKAPPVGGADHFSLTTGKDGKIKIGLSSDKHYGSKYCREDVIEDLYQWFADEGVSAVFDAGNYIDGEASFNRYDVSVHGLDNQVQNLVSKLPQHKGLTTYAITGNDHEGWYAKREGVDVGRYVENSFRNSGRHDWVNLGYMEAYVDLVHPLTGAISRALVMHPGGGSAYAISYKPQKIVENLEGGEKPAALFIGHYHKISANLIRNVWVVQCGCAQDQTTFMRTKGIDAHIGGVIVELTQDPDTGALTGCNVDMKRYFNQGYYNNRWSQHGDPVLPRRVANKG